MSVEGGKKCRELLGEHNSNVIKLYRMLVCNEAQIAGGWSIASQYRSGRPAEAGTMSLASR